MNKLYLIFIFLTLFSCKDKKQLQQLLYEKQQQLINLDNYKISSYENEKYIKIHGENNLYTIDGKLDKVLEKKEGWWVIASKDGSEKYEFDFICIDNEKINQLKVYKNNMLLENKSRYYNAFKKENGIEYEFHFSNTNLEQDSFEYAYTTFDTITKEESQLHKISFSEKNKIHSHFVPLKKNEVTIGSVTRILMKKEPDSVSFIINDMFVR